MTFLWRCRTRVSNSGFSSISVSRPLRSTDVTRNMPAPNSSGTTRNQFHTRHSEMDIPMLCAERKNLIGVIQKLTSEARTQVHGCTVSLKDYVSLVAMSSFAAWDDKARRRRNESDAQLCGATCRRRRLLSEPRHRAARVHGAAGRLRSLQPPLSADEIRGHDAGGARPAPAPTAGGGGEPAVRRELTGPRHLLAWR